MCLMELGQTPLAAAILFCYLFQIDQPGAEKIFESVAVQNLLSHAEYPNFPYFRDRESQEIDDVLKLMIQRMPLESLQESKLAEILPKAFAVDEISIHDLKALSKALRHGFWTCSARPPNAFA